MTHDEVQKVLPWYANKRLDADMARAVSAHLEVCPICRNDVDGLNAAFAAHERSLPERLVDEGRLDALFARIDQHEAQRRQPSTPARRQGLFARLKKWFAAHPGLAAGSFASALLAIFLAPGLLQQSDVGHHYSVLSSGTEAADKFVITVQLTAPMQLRDVERLVAATLPAASLPTYRIEQRAATDFTLVFESKPSVEGASQTLQQLSAAPAVARVAIGSDQESKQR